MIPVLTLIDDEGESFIFPKDFWLKDFDLNVNVNVVNYTYAAGGKNTADGYPQVRRITISGLLWAPTLAELETKRRAVFRACLKGGKLQKSDDTVSRYITVRFADFSYSQGNWRNSERLSIVFTAEFPFWVDSSLTVFENVYTNTFNNFTIDVSDSDFIMLPLIEVENTEGLDNPRFYLQNNSDGGTKFYYEDTGFLAGDLLEIDSSLGTVKKNSNNAIEYAVQPWFIRLLPQENNITFFIGDECTLRIKYRKVYI
jgi:hypothetical protein